MPYQAHYAGNGDALVAARDAGKTNILQAETNASSEMLQTEDYTTPEEEFSEEGVDPVMMVRWLMLMNLTRLLEMPSIV